MKRLYPLLLLVYMAATAGTAQDMPRVRQAIDTLTSAAFHGRGYLYNGDAKAAHYIQSRFRELGLRPISESYLQPFSFPVNTITETPQLQVAGKALQPGKDFVANAASASGKGKAVILSLDTAVFRDAAAARKFFSRSFRNKALVYRQQDQKKISQLPAPYQQKLQQAKLHVVVQPKALLTTVALRQGPLPVLEVLEQAWPPGA